MALTVAPARETVDAKAHRLVQDGRVTWAHGVAVIAGDGGTHIVRRENGAWSCTCPWGTHRPDSKPCSHVLAAALTAPTAAAAPEPTFCKHQVRTDAVCGWCNAERQAPAPAAQPSPAAAHVATARRPRTTSTSSRAHRSVRHVYFARTEDPSEIAALRRMGDASVRYVQEGGREFAVCEEAVLAAALSPWRA